jgi:hypothetical protein
MKKKMGVHRSSFIFREGAWASRGDIEIGNRKARTIDTCHAVGTLTHRCHAVGTLTHRMIFSE